MSEIIKRSRIFVIYVCIVCALFFVCGYFGERMLDIFGTERWEQEGPGSSNHYHK